MYDEPSSAAWILLATLCLTIATLGWLSVWARKPDDDEPHVIEEGERRRIRRAAQRAMAATAVVAAVPALIATLHDAPWQSVLWWAALVIPATVVVPLVLGSGAGIVWVWARVGGYVEPESRGAVWGCIGLMVSAVLTLTVVDAALVAAGADVPTALVTSLLLSYLLWHAGRAVLRHADL